MSDVATATSPVVSRKVALSVFQKQLVDSLNHVNCFLQFSALYELNCMNICTFMEYSDDARLTVIVMAQYST